MGGVCSWLRSSPESLYECHAAGMNRRALTGRFFLNYMFDFEILREAIVVAMIALQMKMDLLRL